MAAVSTVKGFAFPNEGDTLSFAAAGTTSSICPLGGRIPAMVITPAVWTASAISFEVAIDDSGVWYPLYDNYGVRFTIPGTVAQAAYAIPLGILSGAARIRAVTSVAQAAATSAILIHRHFA